MGGQKCIALLNRFLSGHVNLTCVSVEANDRTAENNYEVKNILGNSKLRYINPFYFFTCRRIIKQKKITHVMLEHPYYGWLGLLLKWFCGVQLIIRSHNIEAVRFKSIGKWWWGVLWNYERFVHRRADLNFFIQENDLAYAVKKFGLRSNRCFLITYGIEFRQPPVAEEKVIARQALEKEYTIGQEDVLLLFNGTLDYTPNLDALDKILQEINPLLLEKTGFSYKIIICGKGLPASYVNLDKYTGKNIIYAGFVKDIALFFTAADIFINPVTDGGGIKTKLVEALAFNMNVVTTQSGAIGVPESVTGGKMKIVSDNDTIAFADAIVKCNAATSIPTAFFDYFYWDNIASKAAAAIEGQ